MNAKSGQDAYAAREPLQASAHPCLTLQLRGSGNHHLGFARQGEVMCV